MKNTRRCDRERCLLAIKTPLLSPDANTFYMNYDVSKNLSAESKHIHWYFSRGVQTRLFYVFSLLNGLNKSIDEILAFSCDLDTALKNCETFYKSVQKNKPLGWLKEPWIERPCSFSLNVGCFTKYFKSQEGKDVEKNCACLVISFIFILHPHY